MTSFNLKLKSFFILIVVPFLISGCASSSVLLFQLEDFYIERSVDTITLLPVVDCRKDKSGVKANYVNDIFTSLERELKYKGYKVDKVNKFSETRAITYEEIAEMEIEELAKLGPEDGQYLFLVYLNDVVRNYVLVADISMVNGTAVLIDKKNSRYIWKSKSIGNKGSPTYIFLPLMNITKWATFRFVDNIFLNFPKKSFQ